MQLFHARMRMRGVARAGREAHQHADPLPLRVGRKQLAFDPGRDLFPVRLGPLPRRRRHWRLPGLFGDAMRQARLQRCGRTQHVGRPGDEPVDHRTEALQLAPAIRARGNVGLGPGNLARRQDLQGVGARQLAGFATVQVWAPAHWLTPESTATPRLISCSIGPACEVCIPVKRQTRVFGLVRRGALTKKCATPSPRDGFSEGYPWCW